MFQGKVALITGGGSGIGKACTISLVKLGCKVCISERRKEKLEETLKEIQSLGGEGLIVPADISKEEDVKNIFKEIEKTWNKLDFVVANAGMNGVWAPIEDLTVEEFTKTLNINLIGTYSTIKHAMPLLKSSKGNIVVIASVNGTRMFSNTGAYAYSCSKGGQLILTKMLAPELAKFHIRINCVCPDTPIRSEQTELRNLQGIRLPIEFPQGEIPLTGKEPGTAQQVADVIKFLLSADSSHVTGTEIYVDGAQSLIQA